MGQIQYEFQELECKVKKFHLPEAYNVTFEIGNIGLPRDVKRHEIEKLTEEFGRCVEISVHSGFAFVEFSHERSARDCVHNLDGERYAGVRIKVEPARSQSSRYWKEPHSGESPRYQGSRRARGEYRIIVHNLPGRVSWQDLKDLMRKAGEVVFTDIAEDGSGIVEFSNSSHLARALEIFDSYEFQGKVIHATEDTTSRRPPIPSSRRRESPLSDRSDRSRSLPRRYRSSSHSRSPVRSPVRCSPIRSPIRSPIHSPSSHSRFHRRSPRSSRSPSNSAPSITKSSSPSSSSSKPSEFLNTPDSIAPSTLNHSPVITQPTNTEALKD